MAFNVARRHAQGSKRGVRLRAPPLLWRGWARECVGALLAAHVGPPPGTFAGAQLKASQLARANASWCVCARLDAPRARLTGGNAAARALVRGAGAPERAGASACSQGAPARAHARASSVRLGCSAGGARSGGARSGGAAALHGAPTSRVLGWRRSTSTMTVASSATVLAWASVTT